MEKTIAQNVAEYVSYVVPTKWEGVFMAISGIAGSVLAWAFGGIDLQLTWLFVFVVVDYLTGTLAACKTGEWCSQVGAKGLFKKAFIFLIVALSHGIDVTTQSDFLRNAAIAAYAVNELGSTLENLDRLGFTGLIPEFLRRALKQIKSKEVRR